ncbi:MAG: Ig-like domain-containing protein, partial [Myxococcota bacterium]
MQLPLAALALGLTFVACSDDDPSPQPMMDAGMPDSGMMGPTLTSIAIMPDAATVDIGGTQQLTIMGTFDDSSMAAVTMGITWMSDNTAVAVVGATGVVTGVAEGTATITADVDGVTDTITVTVAIPPVDLVVFDDEFGNDVQFNAFAPTVISVDTTESQVGDASLRIEIPSDPPNGFIGGALALINPQDLSGFNAVTFWAKGTSARAMNVIGIANDSTNTEFQAEWGAVNITTEWQQYTIPLPDPSLLTEQAGLLHFAEGTEDGVGDIFLDDIKYVVLDPAVAPTGAAMAALEIGLMTGETANVVGQVINYMVGDQAVTLIPRARYFTYMSNNTAVATVDAQGV